MRKGLEEALTWGPGGRRGRCRYLIDGEDLASPKGTVVMLHGVSMLCDMWAKEAEALTQQGGPPTPPTTLPTPVCA